MQIEIVDPKYDLISTRIVERDDVDVLEVEVLQDKSVKQLDGYLDILVNGVPIRLDRFFAKALTCNYIGISGYFTFIMKMGKSKSICL